MSDIYSGNNEADKQKRPLPRRYRKPYEEYTPTDVAARLEEARKDLTDPKSPLAKLLSDPEDLENHLRKVERLIVGSIERAFIKVGKKFDREKFVREIPPSRKETKSATDSIPAPAEQTVTAEKEVIVEKKDRPAAAADKPMPAPARTSKPEDIEKVVVVDKKGDLSGVKVADLAVVQDQAEEEEPGDAKSRGLLSRVGEDMFSAAFPTLSRLTKKVKGEKEESAKEKLSRLGKDVFKAAFPTLNKVIEYVEGERKQKSTEGVRETTRASKSLDKAESMSSALQLLTAEQRKSVDLLGELLRAVRDLKGGSKSGSGNLLDVVSGKGGRLLRRSAPLIAGAAAVGAVGLGAYALGGMDDKTEEVESADAGETEDQVYERLLQRYSPEQRDDVDIQNDLRAEARQRIEQRDRQQTREQPAATDEAAPSATPTTRSQPAAQPAAAQTTSPEEPRVFRRSGTSGELSFTYERTADGKHYIDDREVDAQTYNRIKQIMFTDERDPRYQRILQEEAARDSFAPDMRARQRLRDENVAELNSTLQRIRTQPVAERPAATTPSAAITLPPAPVAPSPSAAGPRISSGSEPRITRPPATPVLGEGTMTAAPYGADVGAMGLGPEPAQQPAPAATQQQIPEGATPVRSNGRVVGYMPASGGPTVTFTDADRQSLESARTQLTGSRSSATAGAVALGNATAVPRRDSSQAAAVPSRQDALGTQFLEAFESLGLAEADLKDFEDRHGRPDTTRTVRPGPGQFFAPYQARAYSNPELQAQYEEIDRRSTQEERSARRIREEAMTDLAGRPGRSAYSGRPRYGEALKRYGYTDEQLFQIFEREGMPAIERLLEQEVQQDLMSRGRAARLNALPSEQPGAESAPTPVQDQHAATQVVPPPAPTPESAAPATERSPGILSRLFGRGRSEQPATAGPRISSSAQPRITRPSAAPTMGEGAGTMAVDDAGAMGLEPQSAASPRTGNHVHTEAEKSHLRGIVRGSLGPNRREHVDEVVEQLLTLPFPFFRGRPLPRSNALIQSIVRDYINSKPELRDPALGQAIQRLDAGGRETFRMVEEQQQSAPGAGTEALAQPKSEAPVQDAPVAPANDLASLISNRAPTPGGAKDEVATKTTDTADMAKAAVEATPLAKDPPTSNANMASMSGMDLVLKARTVTFKGDEIEFVGSAPSQVAKPGITSIPGIAPSGAAGGGGSSGGGTATPAPAVSGGGGSSSEGSGSQQLTTEQEGAADTGSLTFASGVDPRIKKDIAQKVQQIESAFGKKLTITSGFRDPQRNAAAGGARNSAHTRANAVDIRFQGNEEDTNKLIEAASAAGIGGIGVYRPGWVHLDVESKRVWGPDFSARTVPEWAKDTLQAHMTGQIQKSPAGEAAAAEPVSASPASPSMAESPSSGGGEGGGQMEPAAESTAAPAPEPSGNETGAAVAGASQENAMAERTPVPPTVTAVQSGSQAQSTPGAAVPNSPMNSPNDPGNVEPDDAAERYAKLFNMAA